MEIIKWIYIALLAISIFQIFFIGEKLEYTKGGVFVSIVLSYGLIYILINL